MYVGIVKCPPGASLAIVARTMASHTMAVRRAVSVVATAPLSKAVGFMFVHGVTHLVVTDGDARPIGGLSTLDIAGIVAWRRT